jgi:hypothetical protein
VSANPTSPAAAATPASPATPPTLPPATPASPATAGARDWIDVAIQWASGAAAVGMFAYGVALSYQVLHAIAAAAGLPGWAAAVWPLGFEAFMASAALNALAEQRHRRHEADRWRRVPWYPWTLTALTAGASIGLNWFHPAIPLAPPPGWLVSVVYGLPPLIAVLAWHLFLSRVAHRRQPTLTATALPAVPAVPAVPPAAGTVPEALDPGRDDPAGTTQPDAPPARTGPAPARPGPRRAARPSAPRRPARAAAPARPPAGTADGGPAGQLARARAAAAEFQATHGCPIGRDTLRRALGVSNQTASDLLRALRTTGSPAPGPDQDGGGDRAEPIPAEGPASAVPDDPAGRGIGGAGNGHPTRPVALAALVPAGPGSVGEDEDGDGGGVGGDA